MSKYLLIAVALAIGLVFIGCKQEGGKVKTASAEPSWSYMVVAGDTWTSISEKIYGDAAHAKALMKANPTVKELKPGTVLTAKTMKGKTGDSVRPSGCKRIDIY